MKLLEELFPRLGEHDQNQIIECFKNLYTRRNIRLRDDENYMCGIQHIPILEGTICDETAQDGLKDIFYSLLETTEEGKEYLLKLHSKELKQKDPDFIEGEQANNSLWWKELNETTKEFYFGALDKYSKLIINNFKSLDKDLLNIKADNPSMSLRERNILKQEILFYVISKIVK